MLVHCLAVLYSVQWEHNRTRSTRGGSVGSMKPPFWRVAFVQKPVCVNVIHNSELPICSRLVNDVHREAILPTEHRLLPLTHYSTSFTFRVSACRRERLEMGIFSLKAGVVKQKFLPIFAHQIIRTPLFKILDPPLQCARLGLFQLPYCHCSSQFVTKHLLSLLPKEELSNLVASNLIHMLYMQLHS